MDKAHYELKDGRVSIRKPGKLKFIDKVDQITFNAQKALDAGKRVFYVTTVGVFILTQEGLELIQLMPGIDIQKDIVNAGGARFIIPDHIVPGVAPEIVSGKGFSLKFENP